MKNIPIPIIILVLAALFFIPGLGEVHLLDWDEINFAEISREMILTGNFSQVQIDFQPFWEKPPLFFWVQSTFMRIFGINEFGARIPNALLGIIVLLYLYFLGKKIVNARFGWWWALAYFGSLLPHLYFRSGIIDPLFNTFIFIGLIHLVSAGFNKTPWKSGAYAGLLIGAAVLTKGPVAVAILGLVWLVSFLAIPKKNWIPFKTIIAGIATGILTISTWFLYEYAQNGSWFIEQFITYQIRLFSQEDAGHGGFPLYHFVVVLLGCFPMSWFALQSLWKPSKINEAQIPINIFRRWMVILLAVVLILFSVVQSKIVHYSSLSYFPLSFLAAYTLYQLELGKKLKAGIRWGLFINALILGLAAVALPWLATHATELIHQPNNTELMATLTTVVDWPSWTYLPGIFVLSVLSILIWKKSLLITQKLSIIFLGTAVFLFIGLAAFIGRIEQYTQRPAIEFLQEKGKEGYVINHGFKSYAPYFYGGITEAPPKGIKNRGAWLQSGKIDKPVYMVSRVHKANKIPEKFGFKKIGSKGMFVFLKREVEE